MGYTGGRPGVERPRKALGFMNYAEEAKDCLKGANHEMARTYALVSIADSLDSLVKLMQAQAAAANGEIVSSTTIPTRVVPLHNTGKDKAHANGSKQPTGWPQ